MVKLSAVVSAYNEEKNIERCLKSLKFADEIIVVDNSSSDKTSEISRKFASKIFTQENDPLKIDIQKNFGFTKASCDWVLSIDADEEVSEELAREIKNRLKSSSQLNGFWIPRKNYMFGKWIEYAGWYPDYQLRLFKRGKGKYTKKHVHEHLEVEGQTDKLREHIIHHNYESVLQFILKSVVYAQNEADNLLEKEYKFSYFDAIRFPSSEFLSRFFARQGYKDGLHGLVLSIFMAFYHFLVFCFIWEKKNFVRYESPTFLEEAGGEFIKVNKEFKYWSSKEMIEKVKNPIKKTLIKIRSKM